MRKVREVLRLGLLCGKTQREIACSCRIAHSTAGKYLQKAREIELTYQKAHEMDDAELCRVLHIERGRRPDINRPEPDWHYIHQELKKKSVTLQLLWEEYKEIYPHGYQSTQFCERYRRWKKTIQVSLRQTHKAGEKMFVDYAGHTEGIRDRYTGKERDAQIFVAVLGASNYTYAEAQWDQSLACWIDGHVHAFEYFGGVSRVTVVDNLKSGVSAACRYEPDINPTYHDMAKHYGTVVMPTRVRRPKDKAKVEAAVLVVERWILARLRNQTFFSLHDLNTAIAELCDNLNQRRFKKMPGSRTSVFEALEKPALLPLPLYRYEFAQWKKAKVNIDYHVELNGHYYSAPYQLVQRQVHIRYTRQTVEILHAGRRVASHKRSDVPGHHTTVKEHMPKSHQQYLEWNPSRIIRWANSIGEATGCLVKEILNSRRYPEQGYRSCLGLLRLGKNYSPPRLEAACRRALTIGAHSYKSVRSILEKGLDQQSWPPTRPTTTIAHENIRGSHYFSETHNHKEAVC